VGILAFGQTGVAQDRGTLTEMSLEDLLNLKVLSATKARAMTISNAPGVVYVFTRADFSRLGMKTLRDVLANVPSVQIEEYRSGHSSVWIRGVQERYNDKILWLIDRVPLRDSFYGHQSVDEIIPLDMVERVEIITGPGSVLYGTNAFAGVVSITTRRSQDLGEHQSTARIGYGTFDTKNAAVEFGKGPLYTYADYMKTQGFSPLLNSDGKSWQHDQDRERFFGSIKFDKGDFKSSFTYINHEYAGRYRKSKRDQTATRNPMFGSLQYRKELTKGFVLSTLGYYEYYPIGKVEQRYDSKQRLERVDNDNYDTSLGGTDIELSYFGAKHTLLMGVSFQLDQSHRTRAKQVYPVISESPTLVVPSVRRTDTATYFQDVWALTPHLSLTGGLRYDRLSEFEDQPSYRVGLVGERHANYGKLLYGTAFRTPSYREYLRVNTYNFGLRPEHLSTFESQVGHKFHRADVSVTFYDNRYTNLIKEIYVDRIVKPGMVRIIDDEYAINAKRASIRGLELQGKLLPFDGFKATLSASRILRGKEKIGAWDPTIVPATTLELGETDMDFLAKYTASALVSYRLPNSGHEFGINLTGISDRPTPLEYQSSVPAANRNLRNAAGFARLDAFSSIQVTRQAALSFKIENVMNARHYSPPLGAATEYDSEHPGRTFRVELTFRK
jgi:outer membrane cobalamin receptor